MVKKRALRFRRVAESEREREREEGGRKRESEIKGSVSLPIKALIPRGGGSLLTSSNSDYTPEASPPKTITLGDRIGHDL